MLICSINFVLGADEKKEVMIMIHLYEKNSEAYTVAGTIYNYDIRLVDVDVCDKDLYDGTRCINTIELNIVQRNKYTNEAIKTVVVPNIVKVRDTLMNVEFEDMIFDDIYVFTIYFDQGAANFKLDYTIKDVLKNMTPIYSGEMRDTPFLIYFGKGDTVYTMNVNRSGNRLIANVRDNLDTKAVYGLPDDILPFGPIMVKVLNETDTGIKFTVYSSSNITPLTKSETFLRKGETGNIGGMDFKIADAVPLSATINVEGQDHVIKTRSLKNINNFIFEVNGITGDDVKLSIYHPESVSLLGYNPNVTLTVTKKLESEEGDIFDIPFTLANTGKVNANNLTVELQDSTANIIEGTWNGSLNTGEIKELVFKARFDNEGDYTIIFKVNTGQSSEEFQHKVSVKSKVTAVLKEGPMKSLIFIAKEYIVTQSRIRLLQNSINIFLYIGIFLSVGIIFNSMRQKLPNMEVPKKKPTKKRVVERKVEPVRQQNNGAVAQERIVPPKERRDKGIKRQSVKKK